MTPWPTAGSDTLGSSSEPMRDSRPRRVRPAAASTMASSSPSSRRFSRVSTLPRKGAMSRSGRAMSSWARRRRLEVPSRAPRGRSASVCAPRAISASRGSARGSIAARTIPTGSSLGTSFIECTARWARPSASAASSSLMNSPFPPMAARLRSWIRSPLVDIGRSSTLRSACALRNRAATCSACHSASLLMRVAMTSDEGAVMDRAHAPGWSGNSAEASR